jgi:sortase A
MGVAPGYQQYQQQQRVAYETPTQDAGLSQHIELTDQPAELSLPTSTETPVPAARASRVVVAKIDVDSPVSEAKIEDNEWQVPKFVVGHLEGTANPGENGKVVLTGHIESLTSGNVFARLGELEIGDEILLFAGDQQFTYRISDIRVVSNTDLSVVAPTSSPTVALITCTGTFDYLTRDYTQRLIVIATRS